SIATLCGQTRHAPLARTSSWTCKVLWRTAATTAELSRVKYVHVRDFTFRSQNSWNARPKVGAFSWRHIDCFAIRSTVAIRGPFASIRRTVSIAIRWWLCRDVRKRTSLFARKATSKVATSATAVLPIPVGAWASRCRPSAGARRASAKKSAWPARTRTNGHGIETDAGRTGAVSSIALISDLDRGDDFLRREGGYVFWRGQRVAIRGGPVGDRSQ